MKELKATRVPPGDRWAIVDGDDQIYSSLTEVLNAIFMDKIVIFGYVIVFQQHIGLVAT